MMSLRYVPLGRLLRWLLAMTSCSAMILRGYPERRSVNIQGTEQQVVLRPALYSVKKIYIKKSQSD